MPRVHRKNSFAPEIVARVLTFAHTNPFRSGPLDVLPTSHIQNKLDLHVLRAAQGRPMATIDA
jgi:hypothetical protein